MFKRLRVRFIALSMASLLLVLGVILGPIAEKNLDRALQLSKNDWTVFLRRPISLTFILLSVVMVGITIVNNIRDAKKEREKKEAGA